MHNDSGTGTDALIASAEGYYRAMVTGDETALRRLFDRRVAIMGHYQGKFQWLDLETFIEETKSLIGQHGEEECAVHGMRIDGAIATVAIRGRYAGEWFLDHLSFVAVDGSWRITAKSFHVV